MYVKYEQTSKKTSINIMDEKRLLGGAPGTFIYIYMYIIVHLLSFLFSIELGLSPAITHHAAVTARFRQHLTVRNLSGRTGYWIGAFASRHQVRHHALSASSAGISMGKLAGFNHGE